MPQVPQILTFLGQPRRCCAVASVAFARSLAQQGAKVLWMTQDTGALANTLFEQPLTTDIQAVAPNLWAWQLQATALLENSWEVVKTLEAQYLRNPLLKQVFGQELVVLPGMDDALALNAIRELYDSRNYDYLIFDGHSGPATIRMWGLPENLDWYIRRFQTVLLASELAQTLAPFIQPIASTILNIGGTQASLNQPLQQARSLLDAGRSAVQSRQQMLGFLVTTDAPADIAMVRQQWGSSQQIGLTIGGVLAISQSGADVPDAAFSPLTVQPLPMPEGNNWQATVAAIPSLETAMQMAPAPVLIDTGARQVRLFMPGFSKSDIVLTQYGPEITIAAGDQRRNLLLPEALKGRAVQGAKFQDGYLVLSL